ncbi:molybdenum cofactor guanylyltransferase MobA [Pasteurella sp. PK-2025]|uniref:molybdenum cofactor guanylyltransferase MobA n=1 Tax=Pasteurella sp. PK-2025 TaxID=3413133 RepID=UPI003C749CCE
MRMTISAVILAGGKARRMGGVDKGLQPLNQCPLFMHVYQRLKKQVEDISINANRNQGIYAQYGLPVFSDELADFQGPLSGMLTALKRAKSDFVLFVPCDCPYFPLNLAEKLTSAVHFSKVLIAYVHDGEREHPTFCLVSTALVPALEAYLAKGERKMLSFMQQHQAVAVDFSQHKPAFCNINTLDQLAQMRE